MSTTDAPVRACPSLLRPGLVVVLLAALAAATVHLLFDLAGADEQVIALGRQAVPGLAAIEYGKAERLLERGDAAGDRGLADPQRAAGGERAAAAGDGEEVTKVVPVEHPAPAIARPSAPAFCDYAE